MIKEKQICEEIDITKWERLREQAFEKYKDEDGYCVSSTGCYRNSDKKYFTVNYILFRYQKVDKLNKMVYSYWINEKSLKR